MLPLLLLTRPLAQSRRFAEDAARALPPHEALIAPLSEVVALPFDPSVFDGATGVILTSANAVPMLPPLPGLTAWCVGAATARAAAKAGLRVRQADGDARALIDLLRREAPAGQLVHVHGVDLAHDLVAALPQLALRSVTAYEARERRLDAQTLNALEGRCVVAPLFSPRAARMLAAQMPNPKSLTCIAISPACAAALPAGTPVTVATTPNSGEMMRALAAVISQFAPTG